MNKLKTICLIGMSLLIFSGCSVSPFSPRSQQKINNNGKIDEIKSNQNGLIAEFGKLKQDVDLLNSQLREVQSGLLNINSALSRNENSGIQILQGDGSLILVFSVFMMGGLLWYRGKAIKNEKNLLLMAKEVAKHNSAELNDGIIKSAASIGQGKEILKVLNKALQN